MLTQRLPNHQFMEEQKDFPSKQCKSIILVNKQTNQSFFCDQKPLNVDEQNRLCFSDLINDLKPQYPELHRAFFFLYINSKEYLVGADPFTSPRYIDYQIFQDNEIIILYNEQKHHKKKENEPSSQSIDQANSENPNDQGETQDFNSKEMYIINQESEFSKVIPSNLEEKIQKEIQKYVKPREKRVKERTIEYVIDKVKKWRDIYEKGIVNELGEHVKPNLDVAAYLVQLSRKTLDDYYAQLRKGEMYGFEFAKYKNEKMGILRKYVKEQQKSNPNRKNKGKLEEIDSENTTNFSSFSVSNLQTQQLSEPSQLQSQEELTAPQPIHFKTSDETNDLEEESSQKDISSSIEQNIPTSSLNSNINIQNSHISNQAGLIQSQKEEQQNEEDEEMEVELSIPNAISVPEQQHIQPSPMDEQYALEEELKARQRQIQQYIVKDEYDSIMIDALRTSPMKSHKGSTDVCDIFLDLDNNSVDTNNMQLEYM